MADANYMQQRLQEIQKDESFSSLLGQILSGRAGYVPVIEKREIIVRCKQCQIIVEKEWNFCPMCGLKIDRTEATS